MSIIKKELSDEELYKELARNPDHYHVTVDSTSTKVYDKITGDTNHLNDDSSVVLVNLLNAMGAEAEHL